MNADRFRNKLLLLLDGDLGKDERLEVEAHIRKCRACAREFEHLKRTLSLTRIDEAPDFRAIVWTGQSRGALRSLDRARWMRWGKKWSWVALPAAALLFAVIFGGDAFKTAPGKYGEELVVIGSDSLSESEGQELAALLLNEDESFKQDLLSYEEQSPRNIYSYVGELEADEEEALVSLIKEQFKDQEGVSL